jgi:hypothetical protein
LLQFPQKQSKIINITTIENVKAFFHGLNQEASNKFITLVVIQKLEFWVGEGEGRINLGSTPIVASLEGKAREDQTMTENNPKTGVLNDDRYRPIQFQRTVQNEGEGDPGVWGDVPPARHPDVSGNPAFEIEWA